MIGNVQRFIAVTTLVWAAGWTSAVAGDPASEGHAPTPVSAHEAVREGNRLLMEGDPAEALNAYRQAEKLEPDAREIPFVQGLAHYASGDYERARQAFDRAIAWDRASRLGSERGSSKSDTLSDDGMYGVGTTYHAEALANLDDPEQAVSQFEDAMQRYQNVLAARPDHEAAREANFKAATMWRQIKQLLEQQQQEQQPQDQDQQQDQEQQDQQQPGDDDRQQEDQPQSSQDQQKQDQQQEQDLEKPGPSKEQEKEQLQAAQPREQEQASREQARRRLREMMQALRERKKTRHERQRESVPVAPVDKDW